MEKRRRALGLIKPGITPEENAVRSSRRIATTGESSKSNSGDKAIARGKAPQKSQPTGSVTPKQKTRISRSNVTPLKPESPCSPLQSPGCQMIFPGTLASPEIEVSWDWSCSQVPNEMLPPKRTKRVLDTKAQRPVLPTIKMRPRPRPPLQQQITEEENQLRLEYYKNILSFNPSESTSDVLCDSTNNNMEDATNLCSTPKRPTTRLSSASKKKDEDNLLFDDSANEFMIECSQAIEEKLKNGEIDMGPIVDINISQAKRLHSPGINSANSHKKTCHGRVNLFPETLKRDGICSKDKVENNEQIESDQFQKPITSNNNRNYSNLSLERTELSCLKECDVNASSNQAMDSKSSGSKALSTQNSINISKIEAITSSLSKSNSIQKPLNSNCHILEKRPLLSKPSQSSSNQLSATHTISFQQNKCIERLQTSANISNQNTLNNSRKPQSSNNALYNQIFLKPQNCNTDTMKCQQKVKKQEDCSNSQEKKMQRPAFNIVQDKSNPSDITSLLDDDFDLELSCLDVDSLCRNSENKNPESKCVTTSAPKLCTQQEIEAKRLAALQKLMMKKKR